LAAHLQRERRDAYRSSRGSAGRIVGREQLLQFHEGARLPLLRRPARRRLSGQDAHLAARVGAGARPELVPRVPSPASARRGPQHVGPFLELGRRVPCIGGTRCEPGNRAAQLRRGRQRLAGSGRRDPRRETLCGLGLRRGRRISRGLAREPPLPRATGLVADPALRARSRAECRRGLARRSRPARPERAIYPRGRAAGLRAAGPRSRHAGRAGATGV
jgi:hypothetical protein